MRLSICPLLQIALFLFAAVRCSWAACGNTEQDRIVWARERMYPSISPQQLTLVYQWLKNGTASCRDSGELWYYRALAADRLGDKADATYAMGKADEKLKASGFNPFMIQNHPPSSGVRRVREKWAVVVGIKTFAHPPKGLPALQSSDKDASDFKDFLVNDGGFRADHVQSLENEQATTHNIRHAFGKVREQAQADDLVVIYFSSHGWPRGLDPTGLSYVLTHDADTSDQAEVYATALQMVELAELGRWVKAQNYVLFLDTCFSGAGAEGPSLVPKGAKDLEAFTAAFQGLQGSGNRVVIAASQADERSWEDPRTSNGYFTRFLLEALQQDAKNISLQIVYDRLRDRLPTEVQKTQHQPQHPVMQSFGNGAQIVLGIPGNTIARYGPQPARY